MEKWLSVSRIAEITGLIKRTIQITAKKKDWPKRIVDGNGGKQPRYHIKDLPEDIQAAYATSLNMDFNALKTALKPSENPLPRVISKIMPVVPLIVKKYIKKLVNYDTSDKHR